MNFYEFMNDNWFLTTLSLFCVTLCWALLITGIKSSFYDFLDHRRKMKELRLEEMKINKKEIK